MPPLAGISLWEGDKRFEFVQFNNHTFSSVPKSSSRSLCKKYQWKISVKNSYIILHSCYPDKEDAWQRVVWHLEHSCLATGDIQVIRHLLFWSCELLFLHFISIKSVLFLQRFCNISGLMKINNTTLLRASGDYTDSYTAPATSACSFPSEFSLRFVSSLLLFHLSAFWPSVPSVWIAAAPTFPQLSNSFLLSTFHLSTVLHIPFVISIGLQFLTVDLCNNFHLQSDEAFPNSSCHFEAHLQAPSVVGCSGDASHTDRGNADSVSWSIDGGRRAQSCSRHRTW